MNGVKDALWNTIAVLAAAFVLLLTLTACDQQPETSPEPEGAAEAVVEPTPTMPSSYAGEAVIYVVGPLSGPDAEKGQAQAAGARLAADHFNRRGGLLERQIVIKVVNDSGEPAGALEAARQIADAAGEDVGGVVMYEGSDPQLESVKQVYLSPDSGLNPLIVLPTSTYPRPTETAGRPVFHLSARNASQAAEVATVFQEWNLQDTVVVTTKTPYGETLAQEFSDALEQLDVRAVANFDIEPNAASYNEIATEVKAINPAGLFFAGGDLEARVFLAELFGFEFQGAVFGADRALSYAVIDELGCQAEGMHFVSLLPQPDAGLPAVQRAYYAELEGREPEPYTVAGYAGVEFLVRAFEQAGALEAEQAAAAARQHTFETILGSLTFDEQGYVQEPQLHFFQVQGRRFTQAFTREVGAGPQTTQTAAASAPTTLLEQDFAADKAPIVFADLGWNSALFGNGIARFIIESGYGYPTHAVAGSSVPLFQRLQKGEIQVYMEAWLPNTQELYDKALASGEVADVGLYFGDAVQGWFVPRYVVEGDPDRNIEAAAPELRTIDDLKRYAHLFASPEQPGIGRLLDGSPGWFSYKIDCMKLKAYRLDDKYAQVTLGSGSALFNRLGDAYEQGEPVLAYLFGPSWPMAKFELIQLEEPEFTEECWQTDKGCEFPLNQVKIVVHTSLQQRAPEVVTLLENLQLQSETISQVLLRIKEEDLSPQTAAVLWLKDHTDTWTQWVPTDVAGQVQQALDQYEP